ncbi:MAG: hypothetical protein ACLSE6_07030 [Alphaproteobacteria bacterium]
MFKSRKSTSLLVFVILLLISFVGLTVTANLLGNTQKFDLTDNKRFSLSPASKILGADGARICPCLSFQ